MFDVKFDNNEIKNITENIKRLQKNYAVNAMRRAMRKSLVPMREQAKANWQQHDDPNTTESIPKNIVIRQGRTRAKDELKMRLGILGGARNMEAYGEIKGEEKGNPGGDTWYWRLLEFGAPAAGIAAKSPMRKAMESKKTEALNIAFNEMQNELENEITRRGVV